MKKTKGKFLREVSCNEVKLIAYYKELARKNEVIIAELPNKAAMRVWLIKKCP